MSAIVTYAPSRANSMAVARPMPSAPPVMTTTLWSKAPMCLLPLVQTDCVSDMIRAGVDLGCQGRPDGASMQVMRCGVWLGEDRFEVQQRPTPVPASGQLRVRVEA